MLPISSSLSGGLFSPASNPIFSCQSSWCALMSCLLCFLSVRTWFSSSSQYAPSSSLWSRFLDSMTAIYCMAIILSSVVLCTPEVSLWHAPSVSFAPWIIVYVKLCRVLLKLFFDMHQEGLACIIHILDFCLCRIVWRPSKAPLWHAFAGPSLVLAGGKAGTGSQ